MTTDNGRAFNEWLRAQLKAKKMSQRQLAQQSGVDHSTISRLIRGDRMPSLGTATKLARGLREIHDDADTSAALNVVSVGPQNPTARVEYSLRADEALTEPQVRQIMEYYLAVRVRRFARTFTSVGAAEAGAGGNGIVSSSGSSYGRAVGMAGGASAPTVLRSVPPQRYAAPPQRYVAPRPAVRPARAPGRP
jgi:transcriptional regulator with XRE-family HTH domain